MRPFLLMMMFVAACSSDSTEKDPLTTDGGVDAATDQGQPDAEAPDTSASDACVDCADTDGPPDMDAGVGTDMSSTDCPVDLDGLPAVRTVDSAAGDYTLLIAEGMESAAVNELSGHVVDDGPNALAAFVTSVPTTVDSRMQLDRLVRDVVASTYPSSSVLISARHIETFRAEPGIANGLITVPGGVAPDSVRDRLLAALGGEASISHGSGVAFTPTAADDPLIVSYGAVTRGPDTLFIVAVAPQSRYTMAGATASRIADLTSMGQVARAETALETACVEVDWDGPRADVVLVLDNSASLADELVEFESVSTDLLAVFTRYNLTWRVGVAGATCLDIASDQTVSASVRNLLNPPGENGPCPPTPIGAPPLHNGNICDGVLTNDAATIQQCFTTAARGLAHTEHTMSITPVILERLQPRAAGSADRLQPDASTTFLAITDEFDDFVNWATGWRDAGVIGELPYDPTLEAAYDEATVQAIVEPFTDALLQPESDASFFGIAWIPGTACPTGAEAAAGLAHFAAATGGTLGSVCADELSIIIDDFGRSVAGLSSNLRVEGAAGAASMQLWTNENGVPSRVDRSRVDGWDYDAIVNRVTFQGPNPPQTGDRVVIAYRRWEGSIRQCSTDVDCPREQKYRCINGSCL